MVKMINELIFSDYNGKSYVVYEKGYPVEEAIKDLPYTLGVEGEKFVKVYDWCVFYGFHLDDCGEREHGWTLRMHTPKKRNYVPVNALCLCDDERDGEMGAIAIYNIKEEIWNLLDGLRL